MAVAKKLLSLALQLGLLACGALLLAALIVTFLSLRAPSHVELGEERQLGGPDSHLLVSVVASQLTADQQELVIRIRNNSSGNHRVKPGHLRFGLVDAEGELELPQRLQLLDAEGSPVPGQAEDLWPQLGAGEARKWVVSFRAPTSSRGSVLWVWWHDLITEWIPGGRRNVLTPKLTFKVPLDQLEVEARLGAFSPSADAPNTLQGLAIVMWPEG